MLIDMNHFIERTSYLALASQISNLQNEETKQEKQKQHKVDVGT